MIPPLIPPLLLLHHHHHHYQCIIIIIDDRFSGIVWTGGPFHTASDLDEATEWTIDVSDSTFTVVNSKAMQVIRRR